MQIGDAFLLASKRVDPHFWVIVSDPDEDPDHVVMVSLTTYREGKDTSCLLDVGDHPWIRHPTCISYQDAKTCPQAKLDAWVTEGSLLMQEPASDELLTKILRGAESTDAMPLKCLGILVKQGLVCL